MTEPSWNQVYLVIVALLACVLAVLVYRLVVPGRPDEPITPAMKLRSRRICDIPREITKDEFQSKLQLWLQNSKPPPGNSGIDSLRLTFALSSSEHYVATITSGESPDGLGYTVDEEFLGITPLFEGSGPNV